MTMDDLPAYTAQLRDFLREVDSTVWRVTVGTMVGHVCVRFERRESEGQEARSAIEICRTTFDQAADSARRHRYLFPHRVG